jgi:hydrogenase-1 operon protein HyaF
MFQPKPFPVPVMAALGPGSQAEEEPIDFMPMPRDMNTYRAPALPEPEKLASHAGAVAALHAALHALEQHLAGVVVEPVDLSALTDADRALVNQVLGEGEVAAQCGAADGPRVQAQESVFAGVWRVLHCEGDRVLRDTIEVGAFPAAVAECAQAEGVPLPPLPKPAPEGTMNAPAVLEELRDRARHWRAAGGALASHVVNLSLLPLSPGDSEFFEQQLGRGSVMVLSRGYGNCRIVNTRAAQVWRVTYFNSQDMIILDTLEVGAVPEVACAARQDLADSAERLREVLQWVEAS